jgi:hypothetical protein
MSNINLSPDQQRLIDMYISQYNMVNSQILRLYDMLDDIRDNIQNTIYVNNNRNYRNTYRTSRNSRSFLHRYIDNLINDERQNNFVFYDYNNPINPSIYTNNREQTNNNRQQTDNNSEQTFRRRRQPNEILRNNIDISTFLSNFLNTNVIVRPTNEEIENASRIIRYGDIENPLSETCPISLEHFNNNDMVRQIIHCGHIFSQNHFQTWFNSNVRCPVCRYDIRNYINSQNNNTSQNNNLSQEQVLNTNNTFSNINVIRNPETNQIDQLAFDVTNNTFSNDLLNNITTRMIQSILQGTTNQNNDNERIIFDPSHNILLYETIITNNIPTNNINTNTTINSRNNITTNNIINNDDDTDSDNEYINNIV